MRAIYSLLLALSLVVSVTSVQAAPSALDGKTFTGTVQNEGAQPDDDTFIFENGTFRSTACDKYGFGSGTYSLMIKEGKTTFNATTQNDQGSTIAWNGVVNGPKISGTGTLKEKNGEKSKMTFQGDLAKTH